MDMYLLTLQYLVHNHILVLDMVRILVLVVELVHNMIYSKHLDQFLILHYLCILVVVDMLKHLICHYHNYMLYILVFQFCMFDRVE